MKFPCHFRSHFFIQALRVFRLKHDNLNTIEALNALARINETKNKYEEAKECYEDCLLVQRKAFGDHDLSVAKTLHTLGCLLSKKSEQAGALEAFKSSLMIRKEELGLNHADTILTIMKIGEVYLHVKDYESALNCFEQALPLAIKVHDLDHIQVGLCNQYIGMIYCRKGNFEKSIGFFEGALRVYDNTDIGEASQQSETYHDIGHALCMVERQVDAKKYLSKGKGRICFRYMIK